MKFNARSASASLLAKVALPAVAMALLVIYGAPAWIAHAFDGGPHPGTYTIWSLNETVGFDPHETEADFANLSNHIPGPVNITAMENGTLPGGPCGILIWNPVTNLFLYVGVTGGLQRSSDLNTSTTFASVPGGFGGGDIWNTVNSNASFSPYVLLRGDAADGAVVLRRWEGIGAFSATGVRVNQMNGKVYFGNSSPGQIIELDPATNAFKKWSVGNSPDWLVIDVTGNVYASAFSGGGFGDQILRLDPTTNTLTRWNIPGPDSLQDFVGFGTPNYTALDLEGQVWVSETDSNEFGRLNPLTNTFEEYTKPGISVPHGIATSGIGPTLQLFAEEEGGNTTDVLTRAAAIASTTPPLVTMVTPTVSTITPTTGVATLVLEPRPATTRTITPTMFMSTSSDGAGIDRFPEPPPVFAPTSSTVVVMGNTIFGSVEGTDDVQQFTSGIIFPPEVGVEEKVTGGYMYELSPAAVTGGFNVQRKEAGGVVTGELQYQNHGTGKKIHLSEFTTLTCVDGPDADTEKDQCNFDGSGIVSSSPGVPVTCAVEVHDNNEPGNMPPKDSFKIDCTDGEMTGGDLKGGNIQIHKTTP